ncbi:MAG: SusC/RagA family TonB-linked outer membrane protein [Porphyromonadaceae bacterium CG2_30_38_12]|nr:MAG: SusC/RagA family TonB-linked outer membrane protein [Porphyromonadaceae bacterium CG2_30_38_12]
MNLFSKVILEIVSKIFNPSELFRKLTLGLLIMSSFQLFAANVVVKGVVSDNLGTMPGVSIMVKGAKTGTTTDMNGAFSISVDANAVLIFSSIGYQTMEVPVSNRNLINLNLVEDTKKLDEVVVVGYGTQKKVSVTGAIATIGKAQLLQTPSANISNALTGRMPGLLSVQRSGQPGADQSTLRIRGVGTFSGSQDPLIMVDGIETDNYNNIDPNEIENVSILKDASATAVYGVRGANGVLIITTRRGLEGKPQVSYSYQHAFSKFAEFRHSMDGYTYAKSFNEAKKYDGFISGTYIPAFSDSDLEHYRSNDDPIFYPNVDWFPYMFDKTSGQNQHNFNINGGTDKVKYFISVGYFNQEGLINHTDLIKDYDGNLKFDRYNIRSNFDFNITKRLTANVNISSQIEERSGTSADVGAMFEATYAANPVSAPLITDGKLLTSTGPLGVLFNNGTGLQKNYRNYLNSSVRFNYDLSFVTKGLSTHVTASYNNYNEQNIKYGKNIVKYKALRLADQSVAYVPLADPDKFSFSEYFAKNRKEYIEFGFDYKRTFGDHSVSGMMLYNQSKRYDPKLAFSVPNGYQGIVGRATYDYKNKYLAEANIGYNGTENFATGKRFGWFPAFSLGWIVSEESFFPKNPVLSYMKVRGSFGEVGNDKIGGDRFLYREASYIYSPDATLPNSSTKAFPSGMYQFGEYGSNQTGYIGSLEGKIGNKVLIWEKARKTNVGVDFAFWKDKLKATFEYFNEDRSNILANRNTAPITSGANLPAYNLGIMNNQGFEADITYNDKIGKFNYWVKGNYTFARNIIKYQDEAPRAYTYQNRTGQTFGQSYGLVADGFFNTWEEVNDAKRPFYTYSNNKIQPGDIKYVDINGDGKISSDDEVPIGYSNFPEKIFGLSFGGDYKGFDFSVLFQGADNVSISYSRSYTQGFLENRSAMDYLEMSWSEERYKQGLPIEFPHFNTGSVNSATNYVNSTVWTRDASYVRLKNAEIGYSVPKKLLSKIKISSLRFYANGSNLLTFSSMLPGADPESTAASINNSDPYPVTRTVNLGFNVKF